jgi:hypothetical protein
LYALSVEHLTEFDWLEFADIHATRDTAYTMNDVLFDLVLEGQGACLWTSHDQMLNNDEAVDAAKGRASYMARNLHWIVMQHQINGIRYLDQLRAVGGEYRWVELPEYRKTFGLNKTDQAGIERHSIRVYQYGGSRYTLDRCLSLNPPGYILYFQDKRQEEITPVVRVEDQELWGEGISWARAEEKAHQAIQARVWRNE